MAPLWHDISYPQAMVVALTAAVALTILIGGTSSATTFGTYNSAWDGATDLRSVAEQVETNAVVVENTTSYKSYKESKAISFILTPETGYSQVEANRVARFVKTGGTLVIADDFGTHSNQLLSRIGASTRVDGELIRDERAYSESPEFPEAIHVSNHTYTRGVSQLTFNRGTTLEPNGATVLVNSSNYSYVDANSNGELDDGETLQQRPVVTIESLGAGEVIVIGDPSIFINVMIERSGNRIFAQNLLASHQIVVFDMSHVSALPPLIAAQRFLQESSIFQLILGFVLIIAISFTGILINGINYVQKVTNKDIGSEQEIDPEIIKQGIETRHPDWDQMRIRRVTEEIIKRQNKDGADD